MITCSLQELIVRIIRSSTKLEQVLIHQHSFKAKIILTKSRGVNQAAKF